MLASQKAKIHGHNALTRSTLEVDGLQRNGRGIANQVPGSAFSASAAGDNGRKRKAATGAQFAGAGYYNSPLAQGFGHEHGGVGYASNPGGLNAETSHMRSPGGADASAANATKSLFASIFALPPAKRPRTIHNPESPPVPPPLTPAQQAQNSKSSNKAAKKSSRKGKGKVSAEGSRGRPVAVNGKERTRKSAKKGRNASISSTHTRTSFSGDTEIVNDTDIKAAATLTDILFSRAGMTGSPRSSFAAPTSSSRTMPVSGSSHAPALSQSSSTSTASRTVAHSRTGSNASVSSSATGGLDAEYHTHAGSDTSKGTRRSLTPLASSSRQGAPAPAGPSSSSSSSQHHQQLEPPPVGQRAADSEAADLMLLLANSPSPARPKVARDRDITRNVMAAGRVLFPSSGGSPEKAVGPGRSLKRGGMGANSFSSVSSVESGSGSAAGSHGAERKSMSVSPPLSEAKTVPASSASASPTTDRFPDASSAPSLSLGQLLPSPPSLTSNNEPQTPAASFNVHDYINISPSPAVVLPSRQAAADEASSSNFNLANAHSLPSSSSSSTSTSAFPAPANQSSSSAGTATGTQAGARFRSSVNVSSPLRKSFVDRESMGIGSGVGSVGRKLFENENLVGGAGPGGGGGTGAASAAGPGPLGSGIDLVRT